MSEPISAEQAFATVMAHVRALPAETVTLGEALGRVLAHDVGSGADLPPFDRAAMDGYALRSADVASLPASLPVAGLVAAGRPREAPLEPGQTVQIMTGAAVPAGADAVLQVEKTRSLDGGTRVELLALVEPGLNVARRGSEVRAGEVVLERGHLVDAAATAVLATVGAARVEVGRRPRVAVLATGDELVDVADTPGPGQIRDSNGPALLALARLAGADPWPLGRVTDDGPRLERRLAEGLQADVLLVAGGVSEGVYDLVEPALERLGVERLFERVAIKPGQPLVFGRRGATLVFGLPGNPVSAQVTFELFVRPALLRMQGAAVATRPTVAARLATPLLNRSRRRNHLPARLRWEDGGFVAQPLRSQGSADVRAHAQAHALLVLEAARTRAEAGESVPALLLPAFLDQDER